MPKWYKQNLGVCRMKVSVCVICLLDILNNFYQVRLDRFPLVPE
jgi:hypothetical protein